jgi:hypothetical protein
VNRKPLQLALREMHAVSTSRYQRIGMLLATLLLAVSGPFGTFQSFNLGQRLAYWASMVVACYLIGQGAATFFIEVLRPQITQKWPRLIIAGLLASLPVTAAVLLINGIAYQHIGVAESLNIWLYATIITLIVVVTLVTLDELMAGARAEAGAGEPATALPSAIVPERSAPPPILERVPLPQRGRLLALSVEDHYVDIVTDKGKTLVLMRLADAIREANGIEGLQIHRSHWVATGAVIKSHRSEGKLSLELSNGMRLPVSRGYMATVKAAGLG